MMIDQKQISNSNTKKDPILEDPKETAFKEAITNKKQHFNTKLTENIKLIAQEHSFNEVKPSPQDFPSDGYGCYPSPLKVNNNLAEDNTNHCVSGFKNESFRSKKIEFLDSQQEHLERKGRFAYYFLPKYGIEEKATQTDLTFRDIDNLKHIADEFHSLKEEFLLNFISNHPDVIKKIYYKALKKKDVVEGIKVNIKKRVNPKTQERKQITDSKPVGRQNTNYEKKKNLSAAIYEEKAQDTSNAGVGNCKVMTSTEEVLRRGTSDTNLPKSMSFAAFSSASNNNFLENTSSIFNNTTNGGHAGNLAREESFHVSENFLNKKHLMENLFDSLDKTKKDDSIDKSKSDSPSFTPSVSFHKKDVFSEKYLKKQLSLQKKMSKIQKKQLFDPFRFFKDEYIRLHPSLDLSKLDQEAQREWNDLSKELKKLYHTIAEQEKKNQKKLKKAKLTEPEASSFTKPSI